MFAVFVSLGFTKSWHMNSYSCFLEILNPAFQRGLVWRVTLSVLLFQEIYGSVLAGRWLAWWCSAWCYIPNIS